MIVTPECDIEKWEVCPSTIIASADHYYTKPQVDSKIAEMSGATPEQVEEMINESLEDYYNKDEIDGFVSHLEASEAVISGAVDNVSSALTQEVNRAEQAEAALANSIATKAESSALTEEIQRAQNAEGALANDIATKADASSVYNKTEVDTFVDDLENVDFQISGSVETNRLNILNIGSGLTAETQRAQNAESALADEIATKADASSVYTKNETDSIVSDLEAADSFISGAVDNVSSALTQESQRAQDSEAVLANDIATKAASSALTEEIQRAQNAEGALSNEISTKANAVDVYTKVETDDFLNEKADADSVYTKNETDSIVSDLEAADSFISGAVDNVSSALTEETQRAIDVESDLADGIDTKADRDSVYTKSEIDDFLDDKADVDSVYNKTEIDTFVDDLENVDFQISGSVETNRLNILNISSGLTAETQRAQNAESGLSSAISDEETRAKGVESGLTADLTAEVNRATAAEGELSSAISAVYTKSETDLLLDTKLDASAYTPTDLSNYYTKSETSGSTEISNALSNKQDTLIAGTNITISGNVISASSGGGGVTPEEVAEMIDSAVSGKQNTLISGTNIKTINNESILGSGNINIQGGSGITSAECQSMIDESLEGYYDKSETDSLLDAKLDASAYTPTDLSNYYTKTETDGEISAAVSGKQDTLISGTNIKTINNESILGSGNINIQGGSGISSAECQSMIDNSISGKADTATTYTKTEVDSALSGKASTATTQTLSNTLGTHTADTTIHVTSQEKNTWNGKQNALSAGSGITITNNTISAKIWSGTRTEWGQISGNTQADMIYFVYE